MNNEEDHVICVLVHVRERERERERVCERKRAREPCSIRTGSSLVVDADVVSVCISTRLYNTSRCVAGERCCCYL